MPKPTLAQLREEARRKHWDAESKEFHLKPWELRPVDAGGDPPDPGDRTAGTESWPRARALRELLLERDPEHYDDVDGDDV